MDAWSDTTNSNASESRNHFDKDVLFSDCLRIYILKYQRNMFFSGDLLQEKKKKKNSFRIEEKLQIHSRLLFLTWNLQDSSCELWPKIHKVGNEELHVPSMKTFHMKSGYHNLQWLAKGKGKKPQFFVFIIP